MKNKYFNHSHISRKKFRQILKLFCKDYTAFEVSDATGVSQTTINRLYALFRKRIMSLVNNDLLNNGVEIDESYFGARRVRGKEVKSLQTQQYTRMAGEVMMDYLTRIQALQNSPS